MERPGSWGPGLDSRRLAIALGHCPGLATNPDSRLQGTHELGHSSAQQPLLLANCTRPGPTQRVLAAPPCPAGHAAHMPPRPPGCGRPRPSCLSRGPRGPCSPSALVSPAKPGVMAHICKPSCQEAEAGGSPRGNQGQPELHNQTLPQKKG